MDKTTQQGYPAKNVAEEVLKSMLNGSKDVTMSTTSPKIAILIRTLFPSFYFWIMEFRAKKTKDSLSRAD